MKKADFGIRRFRIQISLFSIPTVCIDASNLTCLSPGFLICKMGIKISPCEVVGVSIPLCLYFY